MSWQHSDCLVLIVEDDDDFRNALSETLEDEGFGVVCARDGLEAITLLRAGTAPNVILLDMMMPHMNGEEFRVEQRRDDALAKIPVIVISGRGDAMQKAASLGAAGYLAKPLSIDLLIDTVAQNCCGPASAQ